MATEQESVRESGEVDVREVATASVVSEAGNQITAGSEVDAVEPCGAETGGGRKPSESVVDLEERLVEEGEIAGDYLEQFLDILDFDGDIDLDVDGDRAVVSIDGGDDLTKLVGKRGEVLDALQELTRLAVQQTTGDRSRLMLDVAQFRSDRRSSLTALGTEIARRVLETGRREELKPMSPFERKIVHDAVAKIDGVVSESEGAEPQRFVFVEKL